MRLSHKTAQGLYRATIALSLFLAAPTLAQMPKAAQTGPDIVVNGRTEPLGNWHRAETDHAVIFSRGSESELRRVAHNLELLHHLLARLYRHGDTSEDVLPVQVFLLDSDSRMEALGLTEGGIRAGPFAKRFTEDVYFDPRVDGDVIALARADRMIAMDTNRRFNDDCDAYRADGGEELCAKIAPYHPPVARSWEAALYAAYTRRFVLDYAPAAYPRWYLDGLAMLFSTIVARGDGRLEYARAPDGYRNVYQSYGYPDMAAVLSGRYLASSEAAEGWSPYGAWLMTHYFVFSKLGPERQQQFDRYMAAIRAGTPMAEAARIFDDPNALQREMQKYAASQLAFATAIPPKIAEPLVTTLTVSAGVLAEARIEIAALPDEPGATGTALRASIRARLETLPPGAEADKLIAEAECRGGSADACLAAADRALAVASDDATALAWKGIALMRQALATPAAGRAARLAEARRALARAVSHGGTAPLPQIAYAETFEMAGEAMPDDAVRGLAAAIRGAPAAPAPRLHLAAELMRRGQTESARNILLPVTHGAYESSEHTRAEALFVASGAAITRVMASP